MYLKKFLMTIAAALCMLPLSEINPQNSKMKELNVKKVSVDRKSTRLNSSHIEESRMPSSA